MQNGKEMGREVDKSGRWRQGGRKHTKAELGSQRQTPSFIERGRDEGKKRREVEGRWEAKRWKGREAERGKQGGRKGGI